ncbi:NADPH:quinone reductase [Micromonospora sp. M42]|nr:NADPH:quinone reductase [Micromonospora sp. M42]
MSGMNREIHLASRPQGWPTAENFRLVTTEVPTPGPGQVVVRNRFMSVDPYMRGRMNDVKSYVPPFALDAPLDGGAIGEVVAGEAGGVKPGDTVLHGLGWREYALVDAKGARKIDPDLAPVTAHLGVLGMTGLTAYAGLLDVAAMKPGETVFVSGAAGAVGSMVGQIAKLRGAGRVIGSAGPRRRWNGSPRSASTPRSTTTTARCPSSSGRPRRTASTCTSTTSAATTWRPRSGR